MKLDQIKQNFKEDEILVWHGKSNKSKMISYGDYMYIPFSLMWVAFVIYWEYMVILYSYPFVFHVLGIPMVLAGLYMAAGRFLYKAYKKKHSCYVVTNLRVIEAYEDARIGYKEKPLSEIGRMVRFVEKDGVGTLVFDDINPAYMMKLNDGMEQLRKKTRKVIGFYDIEGAEEVYQLIQNLKQAKESDESN